MAKIVLVGGGGYLGGRIAERLSADRQEVVVTSRGSRAWPCAVHRVNVIKVETLSPIQLAQVLEGAQTVVLLAAANEILAARDPVAANEATSSLCLAWLEAAARAGVDHFIHFSTVHVYGRQAPGAIDEGRPLRPTHPYATTHAAAELFVQAAHRRGDLKATILRLSNAFGAPLDPGVDRWSLLLNDLARQAVLQQRLRLLSPGLQARDFIGLGVVAEAVTWLTDRPAPSEDEAMVYNLGSGRSMTVLEAAQALQSRCRQRLGYEPPIERPASPAGATPENWQLDVGRLHAAGFTAETDFEGELDRLLDFCRQHRERLSGT